MRLGSIEQHKARQFLGLAGAAHHLAAGSITRKIPARAASEWRSGGRRRVAVASWRIASFVNRRIANDSRTANVAMQSELAVNSAFFPFWSAVARRLFLSLFLLLPSCAKKERKAASSRRTRKAPTPVAGCAGTSVRQPDAADEDLVGAERLGRVEAGDAADGHDVVLIDAVAGDAEAADERCRSRRAASCRGRRRCRSGWRGRPGRGSSCRG